MSATTHGVLSAEPRRFMSEATVLFLTKRAHCSHRVCAHIDHSAISLHSPVYVGICVLSKGACLSIYILNLYYNLPNYCQQYYLYLIIYYYYFIIQRAHHWLQWTY